MPIHAGAVAAGYRDMRALVLRSSRCLRRFRTIVGPIALTGDGNALLVASRRCVGSTGITLARLSTALRCGCHVLGLCCLIDGRRRKSPYCGNHRRGRGRVGAGLVTATCNRRSEARRSGRPLGEATNSVRIRATRALAAESSVFQICRSDLVSDHAKLSRHDPICRPSHDFRER